MMMRIGMTGGAACGKSQAARYFERQGVPVIDADDIVRALTAPGCSLLESVVERAGPELLDDDGNLNRTLLRTRIFLDAKLRQDLEALLHPPVRAAIRAWFGQQGQPYAVAEIPLLIEAGWQDEVDRVLVVNCSQALQRKRLLNRPGVDNRQVDAILAAQLSANERLQYAHDVIENSDRLEALMCAVDKLHRQYISA